MRLAEEKWGRIRCFPDLHRSRLQGELDTFRPKPAGALWVGGAQVLFTPRFRLTAAREEDEKILEVAQNSK